MKLKIAFVSLLISTLSFSQSANAQNTTVDKEIAEDKYQELVANRWIESFNQLDTRSNITMVLVGFDKLYELNGVNALSQNRRLLVVKYRGPDGRDYKSLVYPSSILIIKEGPKS